MSPRSVADPDLSPEDVTAFAYGSTDAVDLTLAAEHVRAVEEGFAHREQARARGLVYGLTTGVGALRDEVIDHADDSAGHALRLWRSHAAGVGPELDDEPARATMLIRLHQLLRGRSGVSPEIVAALAEALRAGALPRLHAYGAMGTGDLTVLAQLGLTLVGEIPWRTGDPAPTTVAEGDALPFLSSNAMTAGVGSIAVTALSALLEVAEQIAALSHLALTGSHEAFDARVHQAKNAPHAAAVAAFMRELLDLEAHARPHARLQDPFCLRAIPQTHGPLHLALDNARDALAAEIGAGAENPLLVDGVALHHGQFLTQAIAATLDAVRAAAYPALSLSVARTSALLNPALSGLPAFLARGPAGSSGLMIVEYVVNDVLARARLLVDPTITSHAVVSLGLEEHASFSTHSAWQTQSLRTLVPDILAGELVAAVRALRMAPERVADCPARELYERAASALPDVAEDHVLAPELQAARALVVSAWQDIVV